MKAILLVLDIVALVNAFALWGISGEPTVSGILLVLLAAITLLLSFDVLIPE